MKPLRDDDCREWNEGMCWESWYDERSERERCGDNRRVAELEQALADYYTADTEVDACNPEENS